MFGDGLMAQAPMGGLGWAFTSRKISFAKWNHLKYANELCSQMALGAAPTVPTASAAGAVPKVSAVEAVEKFLFTDFPTRETFTTKHSPLRKMPCKLPRREAVSASLYIKTFRMKFFLLEE